MLMLCLLVTSLTYGQVTGALPTDGSVGTLLSAVSNTEAACTDGDFDPFNFTEDGDTGGQAFGTGVAQNTAGDPDHFIDLSWEYTGSDMNVAGGGTSIGVGNQDGTTPDNFVFAFDEPLTNPVFAIGGIGQGGVLTFTDCEGGAHNVVLVDATQQGGMDELSVASGVVTKVGTGDGSGLVQIIGVVNCVAIEVVDTDMNANPYTIGIGTCVSEMVPDPLPACADCNADRFQYISMKNKVGSGTGATADIFLDGVKVGDANVLFSDLDINEDLSGTQFGGFDNDGGAYVLELTFCEPISIEELDIRNLEVESEVSIGTTITGTGATATLGGLALTQCSGSSRMSLNDGAPNLIITDGPGCGANPNATYTVDVGMVSTLYFKYVNPAGGCSFDYVGFKIGTCVPEPAAPAIPECPLTLVTVTTDSDVAEGTTAPTNANTDTYLRDANGNYFERSTCFPLDADGLPNIPATPIAIAKVSPCAEVIEEESCGGCTPPPPCTACPADNSYEYISLVNGSGQDAGDSGDIELNGVVVGDFAIVSSDLDVSVDVNGTQFGGWDNDGGTLELQLNFCEPINAQQLDIRNLEVQSIVTLTGATIMQCDGPITMAVAGGTGTVVESMGQSCGPNPNGSYEFVTGNPISSLTFKYENPVPAMGRNCRGDYVGFRIGVCVPDLGESTPMCSLEVLEATTTLADGSEETQLVVRGEDGKYYDYADIDAATADVDMLDEIAVSPCATIVDVCATAPADDTKGICEACFTCPEISGAVVCSTSSPVVGTPFTVSVDGLTSMAMADNNEQDFGITFILFPGTSAPADPYGALPSGAIELGTVPFASLTAANTAASLEVMVPDATVAMDYVIVAILDNAPTSDDTCRPFSVSPVKRPIPTMGQWALFILALLFSTIAVARIRQSKNHEVKELS